MHHSFKTTNNAVVVRAAPFWFIAAASVAEARCAAISAQRVLSQNDRLSAAASVVYGMAGAGAVCEKGRSCAPEPVGFP